MTYLQSLNPKNWYFSHYAAFFIAILMLPSNWSILLLAYLCAIILGTALYNFNEWNKGEPK
jgi:hypothetical protein